jgi:apolipoprotein N-acyltransferase
LGTIYFGSTAAFNAFTGVATLSLSASYGLPILVLLLRKRTVVKNASFSLGRFGFAINLITIGWISLAIIIFCMPTAIPVTPTSMSIHLEDER